MGDPSGIGPEVILKAAREWLLRNHTTPLLIFGDIAAFDNHDLPYKVHTYHDSINSLNHEIIHVWQIPTTEPVIKGAPNKANAESIISFIKEAFYFTLNNITCAITTAPISKSVLQSSKFSFPGHTEFLEALSKPYDPNATAVMMLATDDLRVVPATIHISLKSVPSQLTTYKLVTLSRIIHNSLKTLWLIDNPRIVMSGLNPHAGEDGLFGDEEATILIPALTQLQSEGILITGPYAADSLFHAEARQNYDAVLAMYHDQALIPLKTLNFWEGVNITIGLPIIRTSPDHGTGFDIAGRGIARHDSMLKAMELAVALSGNKND
jgi:4-hydroxythreonine-4-phosphate dehydrogenase